MTEKAHQSKDLPDDFDNENIDNPDVSEQSAPQGKNGEEPTPAIHQKFEELRQKLEAAQTKAEESFNRAARAMADAENIRRQADRDVEKAHKFALESFVKSLLPVIDTLERALEFDHPQDDAKTNPVAVMREGISLTLKMFADTLSKFGVEQINPVDQLFNSELHEAISMVPAPDKKPNHVLHVVQKGYLLNGRITRPAKVIIVANAN
jgi:molecular chaperone GrpE